MHATHLSLFFRKSQTICWTDLFFFLRKSKRTDISSSSSSSSSVQHRTMGRTAQTARRSGGGSPPKTLALKAAKPEPTIKRLESERTKVTKQRDQSASRVAELSLRIEQLDRDIAAAKAQEASTDGSPVVEAEADAKAETETETETETVAAAASSTIPPEDAAAAAAESDPSAASSSVGSKRPLSPDPSAADDQGDERQVRPRLE